MLISFIDSRGNTAMHFAAKRGSTEILQLLYDFGAKLDLASTSDPQMQPIHWAAAEGKINSIEFLLSKGIDINTQDINGSSPAAVAAQYNQINALIYLYKHGADLTMADHSGDHCLHWAAYKGHAEVLQIMLYFHPRELNALDRYGQSALHLASLRGFHECVEVLLTKYQADHTIRDKSGKTALDQAMEKVHFLVEWTLKKHTTTSTFELYKKVLLEDRRFLPLVLMGSNDYERSVGFWRVTFFSNFYATICLIQFTMDAKLSDLFLLHYFNTFIVLIWWIFFFGCLWKEPGFILGNPYGHQNHQKQGQTKISKNYISDRSNSNSNNNNNGNNNLNSNGDIEEGKQSLLEAEDRYEKGLNIIGRLETGSYEPLLCHSCHIERPLRSKHDKYIGHCVYKFDHFW
jgi:hypothetical protein